MATTQKKSASASRKKSTRAKKAEPSRGKKRPYRREIGGGICALLALCTVISYFQGEGWLINLLPTLWKGLTGYGYYVWALGLAIAAWILLTHKGRPVTLRTTCALMMPVLAGGIGHAAVYKGALTTAVGVLPLLWKSGLSLSSGGVVSGLIAQGIRAVFGQVVAMVLLIALLVVAFTVVFHRLIGLLIEAWHSRERLEYEYEPEEKPAPRPRTAEKPRADINIPLDDEPARPAPKAKESGKKVKAERKADRFLESLEDLEKLEAPYGVFTAEKQKEQFQWGYPNVWAPCLYAAVVGCENYGHSAEAARLAQKYIALIEKNYEETGKLWEKYNALDGNTQSANEYATPEMMGWTAGVYTCLKQTYGNGAQKRV